MSWPPTLEEIRRTTRAIYEREQAPVFNKYRTDRIDDVVDALAWQLATQVTLSAYDGDVPGEYTHHLQRRAYTALLRTLASTPVPSLEEWRGEQ